MLPLRQLSALPQLRQLDLSFNRLEKLPTGFATSLPNLEILFLSGNLFSGVLDGSELRGLTQLRMVAFRDNALTEVPSDALPDSVEWLILTGNRLASVGNLPLRMRKLMLSNNLLTALPANVASLSSLELLRIANNRLPLAVLEALPARLPNLKWLAAADNPQPLDLATAPHVAEHTISDPAALARLHRAVGRGIRLGEGSAGVSWLVEYEGMVVYKQFKMLLTSDGRMESELALAARLRGRKSDPPPPETLVELVGITSSPLGALYRVRPSQRAQRALGRPPSFASCTRDVYGDRQTFAWPVAVRVLHDVAAAAVELHRRGIVHGDLYAHNVQVDAATGAAMLIDLGAAFVSTDPRAAQVDQRAFLVLAQEVLSRVQGAEAGSLLGSLTVPPAGLDLASAVSRLSNLLVKLGAQKNATVG